jgi:hypothetical protein
MRMKVNKMKKIFFKLSKCDIHANLKSFVFKINDPQKGLKDVHESIVK